MQVVHSSNGGVGAFRSRAVSYEFRDQETGIGVASSSILGLAELLSLAQQLGYCWYTIRLEQSERQGLFGNERKLAACNIFDDLPSVFTTHLLEAVEIVV